MRWLRSGVVAGLLAAVATVALPLGLALWRGEDLLREMKTPATPLLGLRALAPGFDAWAIALGGAMHVVVAVGWALPFAWLVQRSATAMVLGFGLAWGVLVWLAMFHLLVPLVNAEAAIRGFSVARALAEHAIYGLALAAGVLGQRRWREVRA